MKLFAMFAVCAAHLLTTLVFCSLTQSSGLSAAAVSSCQQALSFIFRVLAANSLSAEQITSLLQKETDLSEQKRSSLAQLWTDFNKVCSSCEM
jgi:hypothetical protein